ncbi:MAG: 4,4-dithiodibutanoate disulfide reductase [Frankiaceae bacterium]|nr:4,4-dithiodibutanoate disulfide reductase [Frankiaceae bacterium]
MAPPVMSTGAFAPARLGPVTLRNRVVKAATFEGATPRGRVTDQLVEFHARVARGGVGMTTVAYCAVAPEGRVQPHCLVLDADTSRDLRRVTDAVHAEGTAACAQLGHAGLVADARSNKRRSLAPSRRFSAPAKGFVPAASPADLDRVRSDFARAAAGAVEAGFDAVEVHLGHGYLLSSFLSPRLNRRRDQYGGDLQGRARFPREVVRAVRDAVGDRVAVTAKFNMTDGVPGGLWLDESIEIARLFQDDGMLDALELTGGSSLENAMYFFRGDVPLAEMLASQPRYVRPGLRLLAPKLFPAYPFEEAFFLDYARQFRAALTMPLIYLGGVNKRETIDAIVAEGFDLVAMARALLREPDLVNTFRSGTRQDGLCVHCNKCMPTIYSGTRCVLAGDA